MNNDELIKKYDGCFSHLCLDEILTSEEIFASGSFTKEESFILPSLLTQDTD